MISFAPPDVLSLYAVAARGDGDLPDGAHVRFVSSPSLGLPIAPLLVWRAPLTTVTVKVAAEKTTKLADVATVPSDPDFRYVAAEAINASGPIMISLRDPVGSKVIVKRSSSPYVVGAPVVQRVRLQGQAPCVSIRIYAFHPKMLDGFFEKTKPIASLPLPIAGRCDWYNNGISPKDALQRVERGAPLRLTPLDRPGGPFSGLDPKDESTRVSALSGDLDVSLEALLRKPSAPPWEVVTTETVDGHVATVEEMDSVHIASCDPGLARYLGFSDNLGELKPTSEREPYVGLIGVGLFAIDPGRVIAVRDFGFIQIKTLLQDVLPAPTADEDRLAEIAIKLSGADDVAERLRKKGFHIRCFAAPAAAVPPPDLPDAPGVRRDNAHWIATPDAPATTFRQNFRVVNGGLVPLIAVGRRKSNGAFEPRARKIGTVKGRHYATLLGTSDREEPGGNFPLAFRRDYGPVSDAPVTASDAGNLYRFSTGDLFGRYGPPTDVPVPDPARPNPPAPAPRVTIRGATLDDASTAALSPGVLEVRVLPPDVGSIGIGGRKIVSLRLGFGADVRTIPTGTTTLIESFGLPALFPQQMGTWALDAWFIDDQGLESAKATETVKVVDPRRPPAKIFGAAIIWTSRPGPSPDVELKLAWKDTSGQAFRVWLADQRGLGLIASPSRAAVAVEAYQKKLAGGLNGLSDRFRLLTDKPIVADEDQFVRLSARLPRTLQTVNFVRVVPETPEGITADFDACCIIPIAVPDDRPPPPPRLTVRQGDNGRAVVRIEAVGLDLDAIEAEEPGLFASPPSPTAKPLQYRLRRAAGPVADPLYARRVGPPRPLPLERSGAAELFADAYEEAETLIPFVRYTWWAEVRLPAERRLAVGATPVDGGFVTENASQTMDAERPFSAISAPAQLVIAPKSPPAPLTASQVTGTLVDDGGTKKVRLVLNGAPVANAKAIAPFALRTWVASVGGKPTLTGQDSALMTAATSVILPTPVVAPATVWCVIVDPLGRESEPTEIEVTA